MTHSYGAVARGETGSTVERGPHGVMLAAVRGTLSTPALESIKAAFAKLSVVDASAARAVADAAPSMIAESVAIVLATATHAFVAVTGQGAVLLERGGVTTVVEGTHELAAGDAVIASTEPVKRPLFTSRAPAPGAGFRNDALDGELFGGLDRQGALDVGVAALRVP